jgi:hypothetical protein
LDPKRRLGKLKHAPHWQNPCAGMRGSGKGASTLYWVWTRLRTLRMFERFTQKARRVIFFGRYETSQFGSEFIESEHLLLALLREDKELAWRANLNSELVRKEVESRIHIREKISTSIELPVSTDCKRALAYATEEAEALGHGFIDTGHLLLGLLRVETSMAAIVLRQQGVNYETLKEIVRGAAKPSPPSAVAPKSARRRAVERSNAWDEREVRAAAPSLNAPLIRLQQLVEGAVKHLDTDSEGYGEQRLKRRPWSRKEALGHLIDCATTHHQWLARALTQPQLTASGLPMNDWITAQQYQGVSWPDLVDLWVSMNRLLIHVIAVIPQEKLNTVCRIGIGEPIPLWTLIDRYIGHAEDLVAQILARL